MEFVYQMFGFNLRSKKPASNDQHSNKPSPPTNIGRPKKADVVATASTGKSTTTTASNPVEKKSGREEVKTSDPDQTVVAIKFGPAYGKDDTELIKKAKDAAWKHIIKKDGGNETESSCIQVIRGIQGAVKEGYDETNFDKKLKLNDEFRRMMAMDGCFFLQLALHILGGGHHLGYGDQNPNFGKDIDSTSWIPDMFFVGNQIPYIVNNTLMEQPFFKGVIKKGVDKGTWKRPVDDLAKLALYLTVVEPHLEKKKMKKPNKFLVFIGLQQPAPNEEPASDILQTLHNLVLRSRSDTEDATYHEMREFQDLEANNEGKPKKTKIPSAGELRKRGINLVKGEPGISNIRFTNRVYSAYLYVPLFTVDKHTNELLTSLANWELLHLNESERELTSYLRFMRDLARTYKDFKILEGKGIICVKDDNLKRTMVKMLDDIVSDHNSNYTLNFRQIRHNIKDYGGPPWRLISVCLGILAVVQTIFTVLSYCFPPRT